MSWSKGKNVDPRNKCERQDYAYSLVQGLSIRSSYHREYTWRKFRPALGHPGKTAANGSRVGSLIFISKCFLHSQGFDPVSDDINYIRDHISLDFPLGMDSNNPSYAISYPFRFAYADNSSWLGLPSWAMCVAKTRPPSFKMPSSRIRLVCSATWRAQR